MNYALICALLASCNTDELCYQHPHDGDVYVEYDWSEDPQADVESMRCWFYSVNGDNAIPFDTKPERDIINIFSGNYNVIAYNYDRDAINFGEQTQYGLHHATTRQCDILEPMYGPGVQTSRLSTYADERVYSTADLLWSSRMENTYVTTGSTVRLVMHPMVCKYTFEFEDVGPISKISKISASLSGMSPGRVLSTGEPIGQSVTLALKAMPSNARESGNRIVGEFYTFGYHPDYSPCHRMALYVELSNGQKLKYTEGEYLDVTDQVRNAPDPRNVHITVRGVEIPAPIENGGGFAPGVDDWDTQYIDIDM